MHGRLRRTQPPWEPKARLDPLDELVATVLSQHTSDLNSSRAFRSLKSRFPTWNEVLSAPADDVAGAIRSGGIAQIKARRIQAILAAIEREEGRLDLARLAGLSTDEAGDYLRALPGVGPKTAACVLTFSMGRAAFPVDTHVHRVTKRLGLLRVGASANAAHTELEPLIPAELRYEFHVRLVRHGREVCKPQHPRCTACALLDLCASGARLLASGEAR